MNCDGMVLEDDMIRRHIDDRVKILAGEKVMIFVESAEIVDLDRKIVDLGQEFDVRVNIAPLDASLRVKQASLLLYWIRTNNSLLSQLKEACKNNNKSRAKELIAIIRGRG